MRPIALGKAPTLVTVALRFLFTMRALLHHQLVATVTTSLRTVAVKTRGAQDEHRCRRLTFFGDMLPLASLSLNFVTMNRSF